MMAHELPNQRLKRLRMVSGLSLQGLADAVSMSKAHCWELERTPENIASAAYKNLDKIAEALGTTVAKLMA